MRNFRIFVVVVSVMLLVASCGGGSDSPAASGSPADSNQVSGTASAGALLNANLVVELRDSLNAKVECAVNESKASYSCNVAGKSAPYLIKVTGNANGEAFTLYSAAQGLGTANVNPLTNLAVARAVGVAPSAAFAAPASYQSQLKINLPTKTAELRKEILAQLQAHHGFDNANEDPFTAAIVAGSRLDKVFDYLDIVVTDGGGFSVVDKYKRATANPASAMLFSGGVSQNWAAVKDTMDANITDNLGTAIDLKDAAVQRKMAAALTMGDRISIVDAVEKQSAATANLASLASYSAGSGRSDVVDAVSNTPNAAYFTDITVQWVDDETSNVLTAPNSILCFVKNTAYDKMLNYDADKDGKVDWYRAQVDSAKCDNSQDSSASTSGAESNSSALNNSVKPDYMDWVVKSERDGLEAKQTFDARATIDVEDPINLGPVNQVTVDVHADIYAGATETNPYGLFRLDFLSGLSLKGLLEASQNSNTGQISVDFLDFSEHGDGSDNQSMHLLRSKNGEGGSGTMRLSNKLTHFAYNKNYLYSQTGNSAAQCFDRNQFVNHVWRYGVYKTIDDANTPAINEIGSRLKLQTGFPIKHIAHDRSHYFGWAGRWGIFLPSEARQSNGSLKTGTTYKQHFDGSDDELVTVVEGKGKLYKYSREITTLGKLKGMPFKYYADGDSFRVFWNGTVFKKTHYRDKDTDWRWKAVAADSSTLDISQPKWNWNNTLDLRTESGKNYRIELSCNSTTYGNLTNCTVSDKSTANTYDRQIVYPDDTSVPTNLACMTNCPDADKPGQLLPNKERVDYAEANTDRNTYHWNPANYVLKDSKGVAVVSGENNAYIWSGALFEPTADNFAKLECEWDNNKVCGWGAMEKLDSYYQWDAGPNDWNKLAVLKKADGSIWQFDDPKELIYRRTVNGAATDVVLNYYGFGDLSGIPGKCVAWDDPTTEVDCGSNTRYVKAFSLPLGAELCEGHYNSGNCVGTQYIVKPLEMGQQMQRLASAASCTSAGLSLNDYQHKLKKVSDWRDPTHKAVPVVDSAPKVIHGVVQ